MDPREYYHRAERLHDDKDCHNCPPAMKHRCNNLPGGKDSDDLCTLIVFAKLDMEDATYNHQYEQPLKTPGPIEPEKIIDGEG